MQFGELGLYVRALQLPRLDQPGNLQDSRHGYLRY